MHSDIVHISFAIACGGRTDLRDQLIASLRAPLLPFTSEIIWAESDGQPVGQLRNELYARARGKYVYFLDEDCVWPVSFPAHRLHAWMESGHAFSGPYLNTPTCTFFGRAYNFMTHAWLKRHSTSGHPVAVAGNVLVPKSDRMPKPYCAQSAFGGEELALMKTLTESGIELHYRDEMAVGHNARHSLSRFFARAWLHGRSPAPGSRSTGRAPWKRILTAHHALPSYSPLMLLTLVGYHLTQFSARKWGRS